MAQTSPETTSGDDAPPAEPSASLRDAVLAAAGRSEVTRRVEELYARVQAAIDERKPRCDVSGRCCRFEEFGHRLYVTTIELAAFLAAKERESSSAEKSAEPIGRLAIFPPAVPNPGGCPFQIAKLCTAHTIRPFGCRIFFCDPASADWQQDAYERFHSEIKAMHASAGVPYFYVEWRHALAELGIVDGA